VGTGADVEDVGLLDPRDEEVGALTNGLIEDATEAVKEDDELPTVDV